MNNINLPTDTASLEALLERTQEALASARREERVAAARKVAENAAAALARAPRARFFTAVKELRQAGVKWHTNVRQCCRGCVTPEQLGLKDDEDETMYAWTFGGQGCALRWDRSNGYALRDMDGYGRTWGGPVKENEAVTVYVNHGNGSGVLVAEAFKRNGFAVEWDGSEVRCVEIKVPVK